MSDGFHDRNKIAAALTDEELSAFLEKLSALAPGQRTLEAIKAMAAGMEIVISVESARTFRNTTFRRHLERMRRRREKAEHLVALAGDGTGRALGDAAAGMLAEQVFDELNGIADATGDDDDPTPMDIEKGEALSRIIGRLRAGDVARETTEAKLRKVEAELRAYAAREKEREEKKAALVKTVDEEAVKGGLSPETLRKIERAMKML